MINEKKSIDPYQWLFPIGLAHALAGSAVWVFHMLNWIDYPGSRHTHYMMTGFLISFATGFLLTAIPRFTGSASCSIFELAIAVSIALFSLIFVHPIFAVAQLLFIVIFITRRMFHRAFNPPPYFIFLPVGLVMGISGATMMSFIRWGWIDAKFLPAAKLFLYYGMMLSFLMGIGAKLIAALLGWSPPPDQLIQITKNRPTLIRQMILPIIQAVLFLSGFITELLGYVAIGRIIRAGCVTWIALDHWKIYKLPRNRGNHSIWIFVSAWILICGLWIHGLWPQLDIHAAHLIFIGGFGLMTLLIATRVSLAHGGYSLETENKSRVFHVVGSLILVAMLTRVTAPWTKNYISHLGYAAIVWFVAIVVWSAFFVPKMIFRGGKIKYSHHDRKPTQDEKC